MVSSRVEWRVVELVVQKVEMVVLLVVVKVGLKVVSLAAMMVL
jgi:uncharacterized membrane protein YqjE